MTGPVAVTGIGLLTPAGEDADTTWETVRRGAGTAAAHDPALAGLPVDFSCRVPLSRDELDRRVGRAAWRMSRNAVLAVLAARAAVRDAGLDARAWDGDRVAVVVGCGLGADEVREEQGERLAERGAELVSALTVPQMIPNMAAGEVSIDLGARGPVLACATACASGATAVAVARDLLAAGRCDIAVAGAAEAAVTRLTTAGFWRAGVLSGRTGAPTGASRPFAPDRDGFVMAEGAGMLVLERAADADARGRVPAPCWWAAAAPRTRTTPPRPLRTAGARRRPCGPPWRTRACHRTTSTTSTRTAPPPRPTTPGRPP
ncbi:hypothetical protein SHKM778_28230 [Streptomyces sp. KM77-8]|uniref:Ketosynthase family 3 (KS3) domain-containing protein n=1 Tax=Streptomyces haneummycinicus TaxID=3074435 RepID=A0AAT9HGJ2_9ACTN